MLVQLSLIAPLLGAPPQGSAVELTCLKAGDAQSTDYLGYTVAVSGDTALVTAPFDINAPGAPGSLFTGEGGAYVFERNGATWSEQAKVLPSVSTGVKYFGNSAALSGDTIVIGTGLVSGGAGFEVGAVYVFERDQGGANAWGETATIVPADGASGDRFGEALALSGDRLVVGSYLDDGQGSAYVYERNQGGPGAWGEVVKLTASDAQAGAEFGLGVALSGDRLAVSAPKHDTTGGVDAGAVYLFERDQGGPGAWGQVTQVTASDGGMSDLFGWVRGVGLDGDTLVVGAWLADNAAGIDAGAAYVYERDQGGPGAWGEVAVLIGSEAATGDRAGLSVVVDGDAILVGADRADHSGLVDAGVVYRYDRDQGGIGAWGETEVLRAQDAADEDGFGIAAAIDGDTIGVGAWNDDHSGLMEAGSVRIFAVSSAALAYCTAGSSASGCQATLASAGTASATAAGGFVIQALDVEGAKDGLFFFGTSGRQANPWGNGTSYQCVVPPVKRGGLQVGSGTSGVCDGAFAQDLNALWCPSCPKPGHNPGSGSVVQAQLWYRDPQNTSNQTTSLSDALEFTVVP